MNGRGFRAAENAVDAFLESVEGSDVKVGLLYFADSSRVACKPSDDYSDVVEGTRGSYEDMLRSSGFYGPLAKKCGIGNAADPLDDHAEWRHRSFKRASEIVLILTDGYWDSRACSSALRNAESLKNDGVTIIGIGTPGADLEFLKKISTSDSYAGLFDFSELGTAFSSIGRSVSSGSGISI